MSQTIYVYSDESGAFDKVHRDFFVYAGLICKTQDEITNLTRLYRKTEKEIRKNPKFSKLPELKAFSLDNKAKWKIYKCINDYVNA